MQEFSNQACLAYNDIVTHSNVVQGSYNPQTKLTAGVAGQAYTVGEAVTLSINIANSGEADAENLTLKSDLGAYELSGNVLVPLSYIDGSLQYYVNGVLQPEPTVAIIDGQLIVSGLDVPAGGNVLILFSARANQYAPQGCDASITVCFLLCGTRCCENPRTCVTIENECAPKLTISKSLCPETVTCGQSLTYTLVIQNSGCAAATAEDNVLITDVLNPRLDITQVRFNGAAWSSPANYSYNSATGLFATAAGQITVPAASFSQDAATGVWTTTPGTSTLTITGTVSFCNQNV